jgi:acetyltransferase-like isoleucine patch superfamily enzyme
MGLRTLSFIQRSIAHAQTRLVRGSFASFGAASVLFPPVRLAGVEGVSIGSGVYVGAGCWLQGRMTEAGDGVAAPALRIGNRVSISGYATLSAFESVVIEDDVLIAAGVYVCDHTHAIAGSLPVRDQGITGIAAVRIGRGAWIGQNSVIMPGVSVGSGAVVGANSVVTSDVPARSVAAGSPARVIRMLDQLGGGTNE